MSERFTVMISKIEDIIKSLKEGQVITIKGCGCIVEDGHIIYDYKNKYARKKLVPMKMNRGELEELLEFLE